MRYRTFARIAGILLAMQAVRAGAANGDILERKVLATEANATFVAERVVYESDGLRVVGFLGYPRSAVGADARLPCIVFNRGGNREYTAITEASFANLARRVAGWGYVVFASNYRGSPGSEGNDEFGGRDVDDVINGLSVLDHVDFADRGRIGMWGHSRGGMMTYLALTKTDRIKAAVVGAGITDLARMIALRPEMETEVAAETVPGWNANRASAIEARSALRFVDRLPRNVPILLIQGTADMRVDPRDSMDMALALYGSGRPFRILMVEGADHAMSERRDVYDEAARSWFDRYVRDREPLPDLTPHGK